MTERQKELYKLLMSQPNHWFTQKEICDSICGYEYIEDDRNHCVEIGNDRLVINEDSSIDKIITTRKHCFKIATYDEYKRERNSHICRLKTQVAQLKAMDRKYHQDGQADIYDEELNELNSDIEKYHETFTKTTFALYDSINKKATILHCGSVEKIYGKDEVIIRGGKYNNYHCKCQEFEEIESLGDVRKDYRKVIDLTKGK